MPLEELEKVQAIITGIPRRVTEGLGRYITAGARHVIVRLGALDLRTQRDQLERVAALIPPLRRADARPSPSDANRGPSSSPPGTSADPAPHTLARAPKITPVITVRYSRHRPPRLGAVQDNNRSSRPHSSSVRA
jgi:hypothetical protein